jgi:thymidylate kinase
MQATTGRVTVALVRDLCAELEANRVRYCHWKSNAFLDLTRSGEEDLDLLIDRADEARFSATLHGLGFKLAERQVGVLPGVLDYYGHDVSSEKLIHVHAHYQLIVGDDRTKGYRIPLERAFLEAAQPDGEFLVPPPELELLLLVIRLMLKHGTWEAAATGLATIPESARAELAHLQEQADIGELHDWLDRELPWLDRATFSECLQALAPGAPRLKLVRAGRRLARALRPCARRRPSVDFALKLSRRALAIGRRLLRRPAPNKRLAAGGSLIAIVGADGAGKSTLVEALCCWLGTTFRVVPAHLGRPPASRTTFVLTNLARVRGGSRRLLRRRAPRATEQAVLATALARDRYLAYRRVRRIAVDGDLVVCDRYPLSQLSTMDAPRVERVMNPRRWRRLTRRLIALERRYYRAIAPPDLVVVLRVDPEIAVRRRSDDDPDFVRSRWREIWEIDWEAVPAHVVDAGRPQDEVLATVRSLLWSEV